MSGYYVNYRFINDYGGAFDMYGALCMSRIFNTEAIGSKVKKREGAPAGKLRSFYKCNTNACVASKIYFRYFNMMIADALDGNIIKLSPNKQFPVVRVGLLDARNSAYKLELKYKPELNYRALGYRVPRMVIDYGPTSPFADRIIHLPKKLYKDMLSRIRGGKVYTDIKSNVKKTR